MALGPLLRRPWPIALLCLLALPVLGEDLLDMESLMAALAQVQHVEALYTETLVSDLLATAISTRGKLVYTAPDRILKIGEQGESVEIRGDRILVRQGAEERALSIGDYAPLERLVAALRATFSGDLARLRQDYTLDFRPQAGRWTLALRPRERAVPAFVEAIEIAGQGVEIDRIDIRESGGDRRSLRLTILSRRPAAVP